MERRGRKKRNLTDKTDFLSCAVLTTHNCTNASTATLQMAIVCICWYKIEEVDFMIALNLRSDMNISIEYRSR